MNKEEINKLTQKIESCWDENNPGDVRSFDERLKQELTHEEYELITSWGWIKKMTTPIEKQFKIINERYNKTKQQVLTKQNKLQKLSNTLYEVIDKHYTEAIESNNKTAIIQAETELTLIIEILNEIRTN